MFWKPLELKARNGSLFEFDKRFRNGNHVNLRWDWFDFGIGFAYSIGDSRRYFNLDLMFLHLWILF